MTRILPPVRVLILLAALMVVGIGVWALWGAPDPVPDSFPDPLASAGTAEPSRPLVRTGNLTIRVSAPDGTVPLGAEVGYVEVGGRVRVLYAKPDGARQFADAPLGDLVIVARAPGYEEARTRRQIVPGVPEEIRLVLKPAPDR